MRTGKKIRDPRVLPDYPDYTRAGVKHTHLERIGEISNSGNLKQITRYDQESKNSLGAGMENPSLKIILPLNKKVSDLGKV